MTVCRHAVHAVLRAAACLAVALSDALASQTSQGTIEIGAARLRQRDVPRTDAVTAGATFRYDGVRAAFAAAGGVTLADEGRSTGQALIAGSLLGRPGARARWEIGGALTAFGQGALPLTTGVYLVAREHFAVGRLGSWAGVGIGGVEEEDLWYPTRTAEIGSSFWSRTGRLTAAAVVVDTRSGPYTRGGQIVTDPVTYTDASLGARWTIRQRAELDGRAGLRLVSRGALTTTGRDMRPFAAVEAAFWLTPRVGVVAAVGRQLSDLVRGTPDTRFAALVLRFAVHDRAATPGPARRHPPGGHRAGGRPQLVLVSDTAGQSRLVVTAPAAARVELAASFTDWQPVSLVRRRDVWELDLPIPSGAHRVLLRVDGGPWLVPTNLPAAADDFGGTVGVITVP